MNYYSQKGEDRWIAENLPLPARGVMVEIGVGRWQEFSNSLHFEQRGWQTILVEPNPALHEEIENNRSGRLFVCAAGAEDGTTEFTMENEPTVSGILRPADGFNCRRIRVPLRTLDSILAAADVNHVDILSIDTEGTELDVWRGLTKCRPGIVIIEWSTAGLPEDPMGIIRRLTADAYALVHVTDGNFIFTAR